jgi:hypothetical protein
LTELTQGELIDRHDLVLRMNNFRTAGYEPHVGRRVDIFLTTFHSDVNLTSPHLDQARLIVASVPFNFFKSRPNGLQHGHAAYITAGLQQLGRNLAYVPELSYFLSLRRQIGRYPTTGAMAICLALDFLLPVCDRVYLTGFSFFEGRSHYFQGEKIVPRNHDPARERQLIRQRLQTHVAAGRVNLDERLAEQLNLEPVVHC